jgi:NhaA family Na+:H+ antiporter
MARQHLLSDFNTDVIGGIVLALAALVALVVANSTLAPVYFGWLAQHHTLTLGSFTATLSTAHWIKDGLMTLFFFAAGLEIKREIVGGELSSPRTLALPVLAALGGMVVPALIYLAFNLGAAGAPHGWPVPVATDIAFAIATFAAFGSRAPTSLKIFLLTVAVVDDLGAVVLIATVFSHGVASTLMMQAALVTAALAAAGLWRRAPGWVFLFGLCILWAVVLQSGIHPSVAGVAAALCVPARAHKGGARSTLSVLHHALQPVVMWGIMPLFAFAAAGISLHQMQLGDVASPEAIGIIAALVIGKPIGVFGAVWLCVRLKLSRKPLGATWVQMFAVSCLCGIGFTMSLFLGALAFDGQPHGFEIAKLGVMIGSLCAMVIGCVLLVHSSQKRGPST